MTLRIFAKLTGAVLVLLVIAMITVDILASRVAARARITVVAADGRVLADSEASPERMENHRNRPEIARALAGSRGTSIRRSPTIGVKFLYVAVPVAGNALRLAVPLSEVDQQVNAIRKQMLAAAALAFLPAVALGAVFARRISGKLATEAPWR